MQIPYNQLDTETLKRVLEEIVTRDGTELNDAATKLKQIETKLKTGELVLTYDEDTETCNVAHAETCNEDKP